MKLGTINLHRVARFALAARAYAAGTVRIVDRDLAGHTHLATTRHGLFAVDTAGIKLIARGLFYGVTIFDDLIYLFEACDRPRERTNRGRIVRLRRDGDTIVAVDVIATGLDNGCHQIDFVRGALCVLDTYNQTVLRFTPDGTPIDTLQPMPTDGSKAWDRGYVHLNSLIERGDDVLMLLHNGADKTGRPSEIGTFDRDWRLIARAPLDGLGCHSFAILEDGTVLSCGSQAGELIGSNGLKLKLGEMMTRGLSVDDTHILVGGSTFSARDIRDETGGAIYVLDRAYCRMATVTMPAPVMEVRRIDGRDRSLSRHLASCDAIAA